MVPLTNMRERRRQRRFKAVRGAFAAIKQSSNRLGQIEDISFGGLAFKYLANEGKTNGARAIDIFITKDQFYIKDIPIQLIRDTELDKENPFSTVSIRQQGVQFGNLSAEQRSQLKHLLQYHTVGEI